MTNTEIEQLIDQMDSGYPAKREQARSSLLALGPKGNAVPCCVHTTRAPRSESIEDGKTSVATTDKAYG